jgi:acyl carrier protein
MIPSAFVALNALPLTANGKVDRQALPAPAREQVQRESDFVAPRTPFEEILAQVWQEVLKLERISVHDDFFALGGHSLLATQMISRVRDRFEIDLPLRCVFETPTIAELGSQVERILVEEIEALAQEETEPPLEKQE